MYLAKDSEKLFLLSKVNFIQLCEMRRDHDERYETLFQRIVAHLDDNLLTSKFNIVFDGTAATEHEEMSPTAERVALLWWLTLIDLQP